MTHIPKVRGIIDCIWMYAEVICIQIVSCNTLNVTFLISTFNSESIVEKSVNSKHEKELPRARGWLKSLQNSAVHNRSCAGQSY